MLLKEEREEIVARCLALQADGLVVATAGNLSIKKGHLVAITPSGVSYQDVTPEKVVVMDLSGEVVEGDLAPSTEWELHLSALRATGDSAVVHTHSPRATAVACLEGVSEVPAIHYYVAMLGGCTLPVVPYSRYGTPELARDVEAAIGGRSGVLLANHGTVTTGPDIATAYTRALEVEWLCGVYLDVLASGSPRVLSEDQIGTVLDGIVSYGQ